MSDQKDRKPKWAPFVHGGRTYDLAHLNDYTFETPDKDGVRRRIAVSFSGHCFSRDFEPGDDPSLRLVSCDRDDGRFCFIRYRYSLDLAAHIEKATHGKVDILAKKNSYAIVPVIDHEGRWIDYVIVFSLDKSRRARTSLDMRIRSAYPDTTGTEILTAHGSVAFDRLVSIRLKNEHPHRKFGR